jgi:hypothetical protein
MIRNLAAFIVLAFLIVPCVSLAQSSENSIQNPNAADIADGSIVVLSTQETGVPGYVRQQYAFNCFGELDVVDHYGSPVDPNDQNLLRTERQMCSSRFFGDGDTDNDSE